MSIYILSKFASKLVNSLRPIAGIVNNHAPEVLTGATCVGSVGIGFAAAIDTKEHLEKEAERPKDRRRAEVVLDTVGDYKRTILVTGLTMACSIGANRISAKRMAALAAGLAAAQKEIAELRTAAEEVVGPDKAEEIQKRAEQKAKYATCGPIFRWKESISGDEFYAPEAEVLRAEMEVERRYQVCNESSVNVFRRELNLGPLGHDIDYVWDRDEPNADVDMPWIIFWHSHEVDMKGEYIMINYYTKPTEEMV